MRDRRGSARPPLHPRTPGRPSASPSLSFLLGPARDLRPVLSCGLRDLRVPLDAEATHTLPRMERVWASRVRWRVAGATQWPAFVLFTVIDGVLLQERPIAGDAPGLFPALLFAGFFNLVLVAVGAPLAGRLLRRRRRDMPAVVASDVAGTALLAAGAVLVALLGTTHHAAIERRQAAFADGVR